MKIGIVKGTQMDEITLENGGGYRELNLKSEDDFYQIKRKIKNIYCKSKFKSINAGAMQC